MRLEGQIKKLREQVKVLWTEKYTTTQWHKGMKIQLEEINLKRYQDKRKQYKQSKTFQNNERKFCQQVAEKAWRWINNQMQKKKK